MQAEAALLVAMFDDEFGDAEDGRRSDALSLARLIQEGLKVPCEHK